MLVQLILWVLNTMIIIPVNVIWCCGQIIVQGKILAESTEQNYVNLAVITNHTIYKAATT